MVATLRPWTRFWIGPWSRRELLGGGWFPLEVFVLGLLLVAVPYFSTNNIASMYLETVWDPEMGIDREFPVVNWMILPYTLLYMFYPATLILCPRDDRGRAELAVGMQTLIMVTAFCCTIFLVLPAEIDLRDQLETHWIDHPTSSFEGALFGFIHFSDNPWNAWPSLHIVHSYLLARLMTVWATRRTPESRLWQAFLVILWLEWALLCISILTTKQHYLFDLFAGVAVAQLAWLATKPTLEEVGEMGPSTFAEECGWTV
jgi:hypothetical protein|tara:strand:+ start:320 stop:1096 length:777 start_codon:yes stop_codon:yes gene_type:complete